MKTIPDPTHLSSLGKNCSVASSATAMRRYVLTAFCDIKRCYQVLLESMIQLMKTTFWDRGFRRKNYKTR